MNEQPKRLAFTAEEQDQLTAKPAKGKGNSPMPFVVGLQERQSDGSRLRQKGEVRRQPAMSGARGYFGR